MRRLHIVGSGPAGLSAAHAAIAAGAEVCLIDDNAHAGGQIWRGGPGSWSDSRAASMWKDLRAHPHFTLMQGAQAVAGIDGDALVLETEEGGACLRFERLVLCSGARERFLPFPGWTLPGVTGAGGLQALIKGGVPLRGRKLVIGGSGPLLLATAATALAAGAEVASIVEFQPRAVLAGFAAGLALRHRDKLRQALGLFARLRAIPYLAGARIVEAKGEASLHSVVVETRGGRREYRCDFLAAGFGLLPNTELGQAFGCAIEIGAIQVDGQQQTSRPNVWAAGECTGIGGVDKALAEGRIAALGALGLPPSARDLRAARRARDFAALLARHFALGPELKQLCRPDTIVCRCEDVRAGDLGGHPDWRTAKLATRVGMGPCQGRTCAPACGFLFGWEPQAPRLPIMPARAGTLSSIE